MQERNGNMKVFEDRFNFSKAVNAMWRIFIRVANRDTHRKEIREYIALKERAAQLLARESPPPP